MSTNNPTSPDGPTRSQFAGEPSMHEIVEGFVSELPKRIEVLRQAWTQGGDGELLRASNELRTLGESSGFGDISGRAAELEESIRRVIDDKAGRQSAEIRERFDELICLCEQATCNED